MTSSVTYVEVSVVMAGPIYEIPCTERLRNADMPEPGMPIFYTPGYFEHELGHGTLFSDLDVFLEHSQPCDGHTYSHAVICKILC